MSAPVWVSLFSGGKDSTYALVDALNTGRTIDRLLTVHPPTDSYMYHVPATNLTELASDSMGIPLTTITLDESTFEAAADSGERGDQELEPLAKTLRSLKTDVPSITGITTGAVASTFQRNRIDDLADSLGLEVHAPLWGMDPSEAARAMIEAGFEIMIVQVAAAGFDETWLGQTFDESLVSDLLSLHDKVGVHPLGEGGEYETIVTDGPHMDRAIQLEYETCWEGTRGELIITDAWLE